MSFFQYDRSLPNEEEIEKHDRLLKSKGINFELIRFKGRHEIHQEVLSQLQKRF